MRRSTRCGVGLVTLLVGLGWIARPVVGGEVEDAIVKIADLLEKGKTDDAQKEAQALVNKQGFNGAKVGGLQAPMKVLRPKNKGGIGIGAKGDGIEKIIIDLGKGDKPKVSMDDIKKAGYIVLAVGQVTEAASPRPLVGNKKKVKDWEQWTKEMQSAARDLIKAAEKKDTKAIKTIARNLDATCSDCHQTFRP